MNSITTLIPVPRPLRIERAGITVRVAEFTLRDLADLQAIMDDQFPDPLQEIRNALNDAEGDDRRKLLVSAYERAEIGPCVYGEPSGRAFYSTSEGAALLCWVALRRHQPQMTPQDAAELFLLMSDAEFERLWRIAHGQSSRKSLERMLGPQIERPPSPSGQTWGQVVEEVIAEHPGWTYRDVYELTISEFANARRHGKPEPDGIPIPPGANLEKLIAEQRRRFYGPSADESAQDRGSEDESRPGEPAAD